MDKSNLVKVDFQTEIPSNQERAILHLLEDELWGRLLKPVCKPRGGDFAKGITDIFFSKLETGVLSGGEQAAIAWAKGIWTDRVDPELRDPFDGFLVLNPRRQVRVLQALRIRAGVDEGLRMESALDDLSSK